LTWSSNKNNDLQFAITNIYWAATRYQAQNEVLHTSEGRLDSLSPHKTNYVGRKQNMQFKRNVTDQGDTRLKERTCSTGSIGVRKYKIYVIKNLFILVLDNCDKIHIA
jgi:hypothetical protein